MLFNSVEFVIFFVAVVAVYYLTPHRLRWILLLGASYGFYMAWEPSYILLIVFSTLVDYSAAIQMHRARTSRARTAWLLASLGGNCGLLFVFKYFNLFNDTARSVFRSLGTGYGVPDLDFLLPVGISFYTFQTLSYTIDVYRGARKPETHLGKFALYVSFFPQLVAGPIERSTRLLPQFFRRVEFNYERTVSGLQLMLWGFFKKIVIADTLAIYVDAVYGSPGQFTALPVILATYGFAFQIYCDFSGYSDIAIGAARILGFDLMQNFRQPYFARSIADFWSRWHISLSTWFRDYLYIPLGGNRVVKWRWHFNLLFVFLVSGLWHGAEWTFVVWGALHGGYLLASIWTKDLRERANRILGLDRLPRVHSLLQIVFTFHLVLLGWVFFRANSFAEAFQILRSITAIEISTLFQMPAGINVAPLIGRSEMMIVFFAVVVLLIVQLVDERKKSTWQVLSGAPAAARWCVYSLLTLAVLNLGIPNEVPFIYFQF